MRSSGTGPGSSSRRRTKRDIRNGGGEVREAEDGESDKELTKDRDGGKLEGGGGKETAANRERSADTAIESGDRNIRVMINVFHMNFTGYDNLIAPRRWYSAGSK
jgi:hypothetical protein